MFSFRSVALGWALLVALAQASARPSVVARISQHRRVVFSPADENVDSWDADSTFKVASATGSGEKGTADAK